MNSPAQNPVYTPLEALLLFHYLSTHGTHPSSFLLISQLILKNPVIKAEATFDRGRLSPDALREFYHDRLAEAESEFALSDRNSNGDDKLRLVKVLTSRLYERYRKVSLRQIRELEDRYQRLNDEIDEINEGKWDERLEEQARARDRSKSRTSFDSRDKVSSPSSDRRTTPIDSMIEGSSAATRSREMAPLPAKSPLPSVTAPTPSPIPSLIVASVKPEKSTPPVLPSVTTPQPQPLHPQFSQAQLPCPTPQMRYEHMQPAPVIGTSEILGHQPSLLPQKPHAHTSMSPSSGRTSTPKILPGPMPIPPKTEAAPPPPHPNTSLPGAPPLARPQAKIEAPVPVPPPARLTYPSITPRTPGQSVWSVTPVPTQPIQMTGQQVQGSPPSTGGLHQLADVADSRRKQKHPPPPRPPSYQQYPPLGFPDRIQPVACTPVYDRALASAGSAPPSGGSYGILYPPQTPGTPIPAQQQYPQTQPRPIAAAPVTTFQQYTPTPAAPVQQPRQPAHASPAPRVSPVSQKIAPRPSPIAQTSYTSPRKAPPPPINTGAPVHTPSIPVQPMANEEEELATPGSPIPPRPDEISPISTPGGSPTPESPKPIVIEGIRGKKRLFGENKSGEIGPESKNEGSIEKSPSGKPPPKRQKYSKTNKKAIGKPLGRMGVARTPGTEPPPLRVTKSASSEVEGSSRSPSVEPPPVNKPKAVRPVVSPISEGSEVKDEELSEFDDDATMASPVPAAHKRKDVEGKKVGNGRATRKTSASGRKAGAEATEREGTVVQTPRSKTPKRKRDPSQSDIEEESKEETATVSPRKPFHRPPKLEPQSSTNAGIGSPLPTGVAIEQQQQIVVATKKFLQLSAPLLGDISSHKFANLFMNPVNERMAPGYRNLVYKPEDLKSIKAAVKAGAAAVTNASTGTPAITTPTTESIAASTPPASTSTFTTLPATTLNTPPKGIVNSVQLEKELFRMFANAMMYNKSTSEIAKETVMMARDVERIVDNFRTAEEAGMKKALSASFGHARKLGGAGSERERERERTAGTVAEEGEEGEGSTVAGAEEESMAGEGTEKEAEDGGGGGQEGKKKVGRKKKRR